MSVTLDISGCSPLTPENARRLEAVADRLRHPFIELVNQISSPNLNSIDWWVSPLATRNTFSSPIFLDCCRAQLLDDLLVSSKELSSVIVGTPGMAWVAKILIKQHGSLCCVRFDRVSYVRQVLFRTIRNFFGAAILSISKWFFANLLVKSKRPDKSQPLILIDTILYPNSIRDGKFHDRHFPGIETELDSDEQGRVYYFPTYFGIRNFASVFKLINKQRMGFLLKEHYLCISDYIYALGHGLRSSSLKPIAKLVLNKIDVSAIVNENLGIHCSPTSAIEALLKYRAIYRMSQAGIRISRVISWFENQDINRGVNAGFRRFYPNCPVIGYVGYVPSRHYLCAQPTATEHTAAILPTKVVVMGRGYVEALREYAPDLNIDVGPALRYKYLSVNQLRQTRSAKLEILVALPVLLSEALEVIAAVRAAIPEIQNSTSSMLKVVIKPHPATVVLPEHLNALSHNPEVFVEWSSARLDHLLASADVMISTASSACFEALVLGVPVIVMGNLKGLTYTSIPSGIPEELWELCYPGEPLSVTIEKLQRAWASSRASGAILEETLREIYLQPVTRIGIRNLILGYSTRSVESAVTST